MNGIFDPIWISQAAVVVLTAFFFLQIVVTEVCRECGGECSGDSDTLDRCNDCDRELGVCD